VPLTNPVLLYEDSNMNNKVTAQLMVYFSKLQC